MGSKDSFHFLNVDLIILGRFDPEPLLVAAGKKVFALSEYGPVFDAATRASSSN
jgi:hypothetical protein